MKRVRFSVTSCVAALVFGLLALGLASSEANAARIPDGSVSIAQNAPDALPLDHFWCYQTTSNPVNEPIGLKDQFTAAVVPHVVGAPTHLCNPVKKRHGDNVFTIIDRDAHLMFYEIGVPSLKIFEVEVKNQFGTRELKVFGPAKALAVPTKKNNHDAPTDLDHFKCYRVKGATAQAVVGLKDQFQSAPGLVVGKPVLLCNPTLKVHGPNTFPIKHPKAHLVCYKITVVNFTANVLTQNQFRSEALTVQNPNMLCAPSKKRILGD
jgi:hypothetical protein